MTEKIPMDNRKDGFDSRKNNRINQSVLIIKNLDIQNKSKYITEKIPEKRIQGFRKNEKHCRAVRKNINF